MLKLVGISSAILSELLFSISSVSLSHHFSVSVLFTDRHGIVEGLQ